MKINKTPYYSYNLNGIAEGCKYCIKGEKLVLFITGKCKSNCWYCSLSNKRKEKDIVMANERECKTVKEVIQEAKASKATSAGITGGDPLVCLNKTIKYVKALKKEFGKQFHIHIYLSTHLVDEKNLKKLSKCIDEVRFHPLFLINKNEENADLNKIKKSMEIFGKKNNGIELPLIPEKKKEILNFILKAKDFISFVNFNEFELSETNFNQLTKNYSLESGGYRVKGSLEAGKWILTQLAKKKIKLNAHLCTAELKNNCQFVNRLKRHIILPYGKKTSEGTVIYLAIYAKDKKDFKKMKKTIRGYVDNKKSRIILSEEDAKDMLNKGIKIKRVEEFPTYDGIEVESEDIIWKK
jgi:pyruvate formate-lyase activating enzyme-like uncharacterized protein